MAQFLLFPAPRPLLIPCPILNQPSPILSVSLVCSARMVALMSVTEDQAVGKLMASGLRERERRTILRDLERGDVTPAEIVAALNGKIDTSRGGDDDDDEDEDGDVDEDGEEADGEDAFDDEEEEEDDEVEAPKGRAAATATAAAKGSA
jgi:hypothetical protein